ncbi:Flp pilus assembly protein CpaB [Aquipuribacter sp. SD81]|uniref:Flp pilus assembly protein CpaB n=1 Tax=Aquipuribacter sp. SD81 TaxID=3127703 RepID=UPI0030194504
MVGRVLLLIAAFFVAGLGALLVYLYADQADERALAELRPLSVYVVQQPLETGADVATAISEGLVALEDVPGAAVPDNAVGADSTVEQGTVALTTLVPGEVLVASRIGNPSQQERLPLTDGRIAVSFPFEDPNRVADFIRPGSEVAVFLTYDDPEALEEQPGGGSEDDVAPPPAAAGEDPEARRTRLLMDRAQVIAVGATTTQPVPAEGEQQPTEVVPRTILTLALTQEEAERLVLGQDQGEMYLALLAEDSEIAPSDGVNLENLFPGAAG